MPVTYYKCECGEEFRVIKKSPICPICKNDNPKTLKRQLKAPASKFMEKVDPESHRSRMKDSDKILKERTRNHSRDNDLMDLALNNSTKQARDNKWFVENSDGSLRKRNKLDDL